MYTNIEVFVSEIINEFNLISDDRKNILNAISSYIKESLNEHQSAKLVFICTHNSRRSHFGQIWAKVAAEYYGFKSVETFSGGTEATAVNNNVIMALSESGFKIDADKKSDNPIYKIKFNEEADPISAFSKVFNDSANPSENFAAIMTCSDADTNCPIIPGTSLRIPLTYKDPKASDGTPQEAQAYINKNREIAREMFYLFSQV